MLYHANYVLNLSDPQHLSHSPWQDLLLFEKKINEKEKAKISDELDAITKLHDDVMYDLDLLHDCQIANFQSQLQSADCLNRMRTTDEERKRADER